MNDELIKRLNAQHPFVWTEIFQNNAYGVETGELIGQTILDIGANIGAFSFFALEKGAKKVLAYEPLPSNYALLTENIQIAGTAGIIPYNYAVTFDGRNVQMEGIGGEARVTGQGSIPSKKLAEVCEDATILKIDCEGSEAEILFNASGYQIRRFNIIYSELHGKLIQTMKDYISFLGYTITKIVPMYAWDVLSTGEKVNWRKLDVEVVKFVRNI